MAPAPLTLVSATPSPFARMNRIALTLKRIPFTLQNEIPWESSTVTPQYNPLEKLPILLFPDASRAPVYDSAHIQNYIVEKYASQGPRLLTGDLDLDLHARQLVVLAVGAMDAMVLRNWELRRDEGMRSAKWLARQERKVEGALGACAGAVDEMRGRGEQYLVGGVYTIADIAVACAVSSIDFIGAREGWRKEWPVLAEWVDSMEKREEFVETKPVMFEGECSVGDKRCRVLSVCQGLLFVSLLFAFSAFVVC
jgi:glutathione S-transferase